MRFPLRVETISGRNLIFLCYDLYFNTLMVFQIYFTDKKVNDYPISRIIKASN